MKRTMMLVGLVAAATTLAAQEPPKNTHGKTVSAVAKGDVGKHYVYFTPTGKACTGISHGDEVRKVAIKADLWQSGMISGDSAKAIALCHVPGQISSGEMESNGKRTVYEIAVLPTNKKTYSKIIVDASTGEVLSTKQFGGARGYAGFLRESAKRKQNKKG